MDVKPHGHVLIKRVHFAQFIIILNILDGKLSYKNQKDTEV
jgi:hypothetical protein